jgi:hypothetical protein
MKKLTNAEDNSVFSTFKIVVHFGVTPSSRYRNDELNLYPEDVVSVVLRNIGTYQFARLYITEDLHLNIWFFRYLFFFKFI